MTHIRTPTHKHTRRLLLLTAAGIAGLALSLAAGEDARADTAGTTTAAPPGSESPTPVTPTAPKPPPKAQPQPVRDLVQHVTRTVRAITDTVDTITRDLPVAGRVVDTITDLTDQALDALQPPAGTPDPTAPPTEPPTEPPAAPTPVVDTPIDDVTTPPPNATHTTPDTHARPTRTHPTVGAQQGARTPRTHHTTRAGAGTATASDADADTSGDDTNPPHPQPLDCAANLGSTSAGASSSGNHPHAITTSRWAPRVDTDAEPLRPDERTLIGRAHPPAQPTG